MATSLSSIVEPKLTEPTAWTMEYHVPLGPIREVLLGDGSGRWDSVEGKFLQVWGSDFPPPHWGSWAPVDTPSPSFHQPEYFQPILFA